MGKKDEAQMQERPCAWYNSFTKYLRCRVRCLQVSNNSCERKISRKKRPQPLRDIDCLFRIQSFAQPKIVNPMRIASINRLREIRCSSEIICRIRVIRLK